MIKLYTLIPVFLITLTTLAQIPEKMSFQAVVRDANNEVLSDQSVGMQISILQGGINGSPVYIETQNKTTNTNGLISIEIGNGNLISGNFGTIDWSNGPYFIKTETDPTGGTNYTISGTSQLLSVPFALYAKSSGSSIPGPQGEQGPQGIKGETGPQGPAGVDGTGTTQTLSQSENTITLSDGGGSVTITDNDTQLDEAGVIALGFTTGAHTVDTNTQLDEAAVDAFVDNNGYLSTEVDGSTTNEIQDLQLVGNMLTITDNGAATNIDLTPYLDDINTQLTEAEVDAFVNNNGYLTTEVDGSTTNEIQDLQLVGNILTITNNGSATNIDLSPYLDNINTQLTEAEVDAFANNNGYLTSEVDGSTTNEIQDLQLVGNILTITANGSPTSIDLSTYLDATFSTTSNVSSNAPGNYTTDDFVFGSPQLDDDGDANHDSRIFFDKSKGAFRAGSIDDPLINDMWNDANRGEYSVALGLNTSASGHASIALGENAYATGNTSLAAGSSASATGDFSTAIGRATQARGSYSISIGRGSSATATNAMALGYLSNATGDGSTAIKATATGDGSTAIAGGNASGPGSLAMSGGTASGFISLAFGKTTNSSGDYALAMGLETIASGLNASAIGYNNTASGDYSTAMGFSNFARSVGETAVGIYNTDYTPNGTNTDRLFVIGNGTLVRSDAFIIYKNGNGTLAGTLTQSSDARLKKEITPLEESLAKLLKLQSVNYKWNNVKPHDTETIQTGLIAQEVEQIFPELVKEASDGYKSVNYIGLIPHLIEAIKELTIENQQLKAEKTTQRLKSEGFDARISKLESLISAFSSTK